MKNTVTGFGRKLTSAAVLLCLLLSIFAPTVMAVENADLFSETNANEENAEKKDKLIYASIGDSMTNGYGLEGYDGESGIMNYGNNVYANQFAAWLAGYTGDIADDQTVFVGDDGTVTVDHRQLAMSGMRSEDLAWLLQLDYKNLTDAEIKNIARFRYAINVAGEPWQTDLQDNICTGIVNGKPCNCGRIHGWQSEWGNGREYWYSFDVRDNKAETNGLGFASGDWRTWTDLLDPSYRLADGVVKVLSMYGKEGFSFKTDVTLPNNVTQLAAAKLNNSDWLGDNQWSSSNIDSLFGGVEGAWLEFAAEFYQESVADADVITLALGNTNFGTFMFDSIKEIFFNPNTPSGFPSRYHIGEVYLMAERAGIDDELMKMIKDMINNEIDPMLNEQFKDIANQPLPTSANYVTDPYDLLKNYGGQTKGALIKYIVEYCVLSYVVGYIASVERIVALNPDVELIQVALMNSYKTENGTTEKDGATFADMIDMIYTPMNAFLAAMPTYLANKNPEKYENAKFYFSDTGNVETLSAVYGDDYYTYNGESITYDEYQEMLANGTLDVTKLGHNTSSTVRSRFHKWIAGNDGCKHDCSGGDQLKDWGAHAYISDCYLCMEIKHNPNDSSYGWGKFEYAELLKYIVGPMECPYPDDTVSPTQEDINKYNNGWDFNKFFNKYRMVMVTQADVREYEKMTTEAKNAMLVSDEYFDSYKTQKGTSVPYATRKDGTTAKVSKADWAFSCAMYLALEEATIMAGNQEFALSDLTGVQGFTPATFVGVKDQFAVTMGQPVFGEGADLATPDADAIRVGFRNALLNDGPTVTLLCLANRMQIGSGIGGHPSEGGHDTMAAAIQRDYLAKQTSEEGLKNVLQAFFEQNYPNLAAAMGSAGEVDDLDIIIAMLKMSNSAALEGVDLDKLENDIRVAISDYTAGKSKEELDTAMAAAEKAIATLKKLATKATYNKYEANADSFYVSLGDSNVNGFGLAGYVEGMQNGAGQVVAGSAPVIIAKELYGDNWMNHFGQYAQGALRAEDLLYILGGEGVVLDGYYYTEIEPNLLKGDIDSTRADYIAALTKADLISLAVGGGNVTTFVGRQVDLVLEGKEIVEMDWAKIGFESAAMTELQALLDMAVPLVDALGLADKYLPEGMTLGKAGTAKFATVLLESLLYGYASYNYYYPQVLARIREINPDAQLLILGMFNPVDDWKMSINVDGKDEIINIGGVTNNVMESANLQNLAYALQNENTTFVDISNTITFLDEDVKFGKVEATFEVYYKSILQGNGKEVHASAAGHEYIAAQMLAAVQEDSDSDNFAMLDSVKDVYDYLNENGYITTNQLLDVLVYAFDRVENDKLVDGAEVEIVDYVYKTLVKNEELTDAERLEIIGTVYALLKGDFLGGGSPVLETVGDIYSALKDQGLITEAQAFAIVDFVYDVIIDGELDSEEIVDVIRFVYYTLFFEEKTEAVAFALCAFVMPDLEELQAVGAGEKIAILNTVVEELKADGYVTEDSTFAPVVTLYENLVSNENVSDETLAAVLDIAIESVIAKESLSAENAIDIGFEIADKVANSDEIPADAKEIVSGEIYEAVTNIKIEGSNGNSFEIPQGIQNIIDRLYVRNLLTRTQVLQITAKLRPLISGNEDVSVVDLVKDVAQIVFGREGLTTQDKILIVLNLYTALKNEGYITDEQLVQYVEDYYLVALGAAFVYAYNEGYVDVAADALYVAADALEAAKEEILKSDIDAALKDAAIAEIDAAIATILNVADTAKNPDFESADELLNWISDLEDDVYAHLDSAKAILDLVGNNALDAAYDIWNNDVKPEIDAFLADIEENGLEYLGEALKEWAPVIGEAAWEALLGTPAAVKAFIGFVKEYGPYVVDFFDEYGVEFVTIFGNIAVEYGFDVLEAMIEMGEEGLVALKGLVDVWGAEAWSVIRLYADALDIEARAQAEIAFVIATIQEQIVDLEGYLAVLKADLAALEAELYVALEDIQEELRAQIEAIKEKIAEIEAFIDSLVAELEKLIEEAKRIAEEIGKIVEAIIDLAKAIASGSLEAIKDAFAAFKDALAGLIDVFAAAENILKYLTAFAEMLGDIADAIAERLAFIAEKLAEIQKYLADKINAAIEELEACVLTLIAYVNEAILFVTEALKCAAEKLNAAVVELNNRVNAFIDAVNALYDSAFNADYEFDRGNSHYVAIGDASAAEGVTSYVDLIAEHFGMNANHYTDLTGVDLGFTLKDALEALSYNDDAIKAADLITFNYNNTAVYEYVMQQAFANTTDWSEIVGAELAGYIDELAALATEEVAKILEDNMDNLGDLGALTDLITPEVIVNIVEAYAYAYIARIVLIHQIVDELHTLAPEALVVIVGAFNDFEGVEFEVEGYTVELGKYLNVVTEAVNTSAFFCALFDENTIFVPVGSVETKLVYDAESELSVLDYALAALTSPALLLPSEAGNELIAEKILAALNISYADHEHVYDNRCDTTCNTCGDVRYAVHTYSNACDDTCNICGFVRDDAADHEYDADCDAFCNVCGEERTAAAHTFGSWKTDREPTYNIMGRKSRSCTKCGHTEYDHIPVLVVEKAADGVSAGVVVAITIPSILALAAGGFAAFWFGYKKKTFKDLVKVLEKALAVFKK